MKWKTKWGRWFDSGEETKAFREVFNSPAGTFYVLPALADFCGAAEHAPKDGDLFKQGRAAGRRDVWLYLQEHLNMTEEELYGMLKGQPILKPRMTNG